MGVPSIRTGASKFNNGRKHRHKSPLDKAKAYEVVWQQVAPLFEAARPFLDGCFVYVIGEADDGALKIGMSKDPVGRLRTMQTGNPRRLRIEYVLVGHLELEKLLHELWEPFAIFSASQEGKTNVNPGTEWFKAEARETLVPILEDAMKRQVDLLGATTEGNIYASDLERVVRDAHWENGFEPKGRDETWLLAQGAGYVIRRASRI